MKLTLKLAVLPILWSCCFGSEAMNNDYWRQAQQLRLQYRQDVICYANDPVALQQVEQQYQQNMQQLNQDYYNWRNRN